MIRQEPPLLPGPASSVERRGISLRSSRPISRGEGDVSWSEGDIRAKAIALTQIDETAVRAIYLENGDYDAGMAALSDPAALDISAWVIRGDPAQGGLIADEHVPALAERIGSDHVITIAGAGHSPQRTHPEATILAILRALA
jgi:pimeloyl-ACP methyl ester carboxylesterase